MLKLSKYKGQKADFYIQSHGLHAGRPLKKPIPNCFAVKTKRQNAFEIVFCLYKGRAFEYFICGSVIPFIRKFEIEPFLKKEFEKDLKLELLDRILKADELLKNLENQIKLVKQLQYATAREVYK